MCILSKEVEGDESKYLGIHPLNDKDMMWLIELIADLLLRRD
jgi:3-hydroxyacyl-CoA dehydrogenase